MQPRTTMRPGVRRINREKVERREKENQDSERTFSISALTKAFFESIEVPYFCSSLARSCFLVIVVISDSAIRLRMSSLIWLSEGRPEAAASPASRGGLRLPTEGGRLPLRAHGVGVGTLDLWEGEPTGFDQGQYLTLTVSARLIGAELFASR